MYLEKFDMTPSLTTAAKIIEDINVVLYNQQATAVMYDTACLSMFLLWPVVDSVTNPIGLLGL